MKSFDYCVRTSIPAFSLSDINIAYTGVVCACERRALEKIILEGYHVLESIVGSSRV